MHLKRERDLCLTSSTLVHKMSQQAAQKSAELFSSWEEDTFLCQTQQCLQCLKLHLDEQSLDGLFSQRALSYEVKMSQ